MFTIVKIILSIATTIGILTFLLWVGWKGLIAMVFGMIIAVLAYEYPPLRAMVEILGNVKLDQQKQKQIKIKKVK